MDFDIIKKLLLEAGYTTVDLNNSKELKLIELVVKECQDIISGRANGLTDDHWISHNNAVWCCYCDIRDYFYDSEG